MTFPFITALPNGSEVLAMRLNTAQDLRWFRRYKLIAVMGMGAVVAVPIEWVIMSMFDQAYSLVAALLCAVGMGTGYLVEHIAMRVTRYQESWEIDFTYENKVKIPRKLTWVCWLITAALMVALAIGVGNLLNLLRIQMFGEPIARETLLIFEVFLGVTLTIAGCIGAYLRPFGFYQIVGLRSLVECVTIFAFVGAMESVYGRFQTVSFFFILCMLIYISSMAIIMNQLHVIQSSYFSPTCHATDELRHAGIKAVGRMLGTCLKYAWLLLAALSLLTFPLRFLTYFSSETPAFPWLFSFPFSGRPVINLIVFILSLLTMIAIILYLCLRVKNPGIDTQLDNIRHFWGYVWHHVKRLWNRIRLGLRLVMLTTPGQYRKKRQDKKEQAEQIKLTYEDTVIVRTRPRALSETVISYGAFSRRLLALPDAKAQYAYAYRTLVGCLIRKYIGIDEHTTPQDIADIVKARTNIRDIDKITALFYASAYAPEAPSPTVNELVALCDVVRAELERERKTK